MATDLPAGISLDELYVVPGSRMLHSDDCQHQTEKSFAVMQAASPEQIAEYELCKSCRRVLTGGRRHYFSSFEEAMREYHPPLENRPRMREIAAEHDPTIIWIPPAGTYIALAPGKGMGATAHFHNDLRTGTTFGCCYLYTGQAAGKGFGHTIYRNIFQVFCTN